VARLPAEAVHSTPGQGTSGLLLGLVLGLFVGGVLMVFLERSDARADDPGDVEDALGLPATRLTNRTLGSQVALAERWRTNASREPATVALVPATARGERAAESAAGVLGAEQVRERVLPGGELGEGDGRGVVLTPAARPGREPSGEAVGISSDVVVLVVRKGDRLRAARERLHALGSLGIEVERILFVPGRLSAPRRT
jgi:hypothetical protein